MIFMVISRNKFYSAVLFADFFITKVLMAYGTRFKVMDSRLTHFL